MILKVLRSILRKSSPGKEINLEDLIRVEVFGLYLPCCLMLQTPDLAISIGPEPVPGLWALGWTVKVWQQKSGVPVLIYYPPKG